MTNRAVPGPKPKLFLMAAIHSSGTTDDWAYGELGVAAYTFEMGTTFFEGCSSFENSVLPDNAAALLYAFKAARRPYQTPSGPDSLSLSLSSRTIDAGGRVTLTAVADDTRYASGGHGIEPAQRIVTARYTVDAPSWVTGVISYSLSAADGAFDSPVESLRASVDTTGWAPGRHLLFVESRDADGNWGVPSTAFLQEGHHLYLPLIAR